MCVYSRNASVLPTGHSQNMTCQNCSRLSHGTLRNDTHTVWERIHGGKHRLKTTHSNESSFVRGQGDIFFYICIQHLVSSNVQGFNTSIVSTVEKQDWTTAEGISCVMFWCPQVLSQSKQQSIQATRSSLKTVADIWPGDDGISCAVMSPLIKIQRVINLSMETPEMAKTAIVVYRDCTAFTN